MANTHTYTDEQVAQALATLEANRGNAKKTALQLGIPRATLRGWAGRSQSSSSHPKQVVLSELVDQRGRLAKNWERVALDATEMLPAKLETASAKDLAVISGIATEKVELLRGRPTSRSEGLRITFVGGHKSLKELSQAVLKGDIPVLPELGDGQIRDIGRESPQE